MDFLTEHCEPSMYVTTLCDTTVPITINKKNILNIFVVSFPAVSPIKESFFKPISCPFFSKLLLSFLVNYFLY